MQVYPQGRGMDAMVKSWTIKEGLVVEAIPLEDIKAAYSNIEKDLHCVSTKLNAEWIPADIYAALRAGSAELFVMYKNDYYVGFGVLTLVDNFDGEKSLFIWVAYANPEYNVIEEGFKFLDRLSEDLNVTGIEFNSTRSGWTRMVNRYGYTEKTKVFRKEV